jgi:hypothetical protein
MRPVSSVYSRGTIHLGKWQSENHGGGCKQGCMLLVLTVSSITFHKHQTGGCLSLNGVHLQEGKLNTGRRPLRIDLDGQ